jgi:hypothetical protein
VTAQCNSAAGARTGIAQLPWRPGADEMLLEVVKAVWMPTGRPLLLLHSAYGLRPAIRDAEARLTAAGFVGSGPCRAYGRMLQMAD